MRTTARPSSSWKQSGYAAHGLILGFVLVLLYLMVSAQLSYSNPHGNLYHISIATVCFFFFFFRVLVGIDSRNYLYEIAMNGGLLLYRLLLTTSFCAHTQRQLMLAQQQSAQLKRFLQDDKEAIKNAVYMRGFVY